MNAARVRRLLGLLLLMVAAFSLRGIGREHVLREDGTRFWEFDPYYHVWRVFQTLRDYPHVPVFDKSMNVPKGATVIWPPLYDFTIASAARLVGDGPEDTRAVERVAAYVPPLLGALTVLPLFFLARRLLGDGVWPWLAVAFFVPSPVHMWYSRLGFVDHHVAVTLFVVLMLLAFLRALDAGAGLWPTAVATLVLLGAFLVWNGFLFFAFVLDVALLVLMFVERDDPASRVWRVGLVTHAAVALLLIPFVQPIVAASGQPFSPLTLSWLEVVALAAFALVAGLEGLRRTAPMAALGVRMRFALLAAPLVLLAGVMAYYVPRLRQGFEFLAASDRCMASVLEAGSPFLTNGQLDIVHPWAWLSGLFFVMPIAIVRLAREQWREGFRDRGRLLLLVAGTLPFLMALQQRRFAEPFVPLQGLLAADLLRAVYVSLRDWRLGGAAASEDKLSRQERRRAQRRSVEAPVKTMGAAVAAAAVALFVVLAFAWSPSNYAVALDSDARYNRETYMDLQRFAGFLDSREGKTPVGVARPEGAISIWDLGHRIMYVTHLPVVTNNFGLYMGPDSWHDASAFFMETDEAQAVAALEARHVRYVVGDYDLNMAQLLVGYLYLPPEKYFEIVKDSTLMKPPFTRTMYFRFGSSYMGSQGLATYPDGTKQPIEPLHHFRLLMETPNRDAIRPLRIFERVAGARLAISGAPSGGLKLSYVWRTPEGRDRRYRLELPVADGRTEAVVPYSSARPDLGQTSALRIEGADGRVLSVSVAEEAVTQGTPVQAAWSDAAVAPR